LNPFFDLKTLWQLKNIIEKEKIELIFSYTIKPVIYGSIVAKFCGIKNIYSLITGLGYIFIDDSVRGKILRSLVQTLYSIALKANQKVFFQNSDDLNLFVKNKIVAEKKSIVINGSGVDLDSFSYSSVPNNCIFLFVGRLIKDKGIMEYLAAAQKIKSRYQQAKFQLVGASDKNPTSITAEELRHITTSGIVEYLGFLNDVRPAIKAASVFVLPSYREGTSKAVLEAMSMGRPIITTDAPGCRETVVDGVNGFLVPIKNTEKLAEAMEKFILHPELMVKMGKESRHLAEEKYDVHKVNKVILQTMDIG
jgi:glycosyltransferase involved in cell wall biosynthesis